MKSIGIIVEFNPFHYGHKYFIDKVRELFPNHTVVCIMSGNFTERGDVSIINKWNKTKIALDNNIDIVVELPYLYATQSADYFAYAALKILNELKIDTLVFGSECNDINKLYNLANLQLENDNKIKDIINSNINYPKAISNIYNENIDKPNDILGISYIKEIIKNNYNIKPYTIKRTNDYNSNELAKICSSSALRSALKNGIDIKSYIPYDISLIEYKDLNDYFNLIKYQIISNDNLNNILGVDEGIENRFKKYIFDSNNLDDFILKVKCKRYTYNRIKRTIVHILCQTYKSANRNIDYIRVLGFSKDGQKYLSSIKTDLKIVYNYKKNISPLFDIEYKSSIIYDYKNKEKEYKTSVIKH